MTSPDTATDVVEALRAARSDGELPKVRKRLADDEEAFGLRMHVLADHDDPLRRRTVITASLSFIHNGSDDRLAGAFAVATRLAIEKLDPDQRRRYLT